MKITLDHNCIIHLIEKNEIGRAIRRIIEDLQNECFVVNMGASEARKLGVRPDSYDTFEAMLVDAGIADLERLNPPAMFDVSFFDHCVFPDDQTGEQLERIEKILFPNRLDVDLATLDLETDIGRRWLNRLCDVHTMWCHLQNKSDVFLTTDSNFKKQTKLPQLIALGAGRICHPSDPGLASNHSPA